MVILTSFKHAWPSVFSVLLHLICDLRSLLFCYVWPLTFSSHCSVTVDLWPAVFVLNLTHDLQSLLFCYIWPVTFSLNCSVTVELWPSVFTVLLQLTWPRTPSEKLLADMFEGSAAQFLCILESLTDTNRRILLTAPPASEAEVEILDVYAELFMAGQEILAGG